MINMVYFTFANNIKNHQKQCLQKKKYSPKYYMITNRVSSL